MITNLPGDDPRVTYLERYATRNDEHRPRVTWMNPRLTRNGHVKVIMGGGHKNEYK